MAKKRLKYTYDDLLLLEERIQQLNTKLIKGKANGSDVLKLQQLRTDKEQMIKYLEKEGATV